MSVTTKLKRYASIVDKIQTAKYPTLADLVRHLENQDIEVSDRTIQRDLEQLRSDFEIAVEYDRYHRGYYIEKNDLTQKMIHFLQSQSISTHLMDYVKNNPNNSTTVLFSETTAKSGVEHINKILEAISKNRKIEFIYKKFLSDKSKKYIFQPYALKEYQQRWYVVGIADSSSTILKFGLERIESIEVGKQKFVRNKNIDIKEHFDRMIGIHSENENREVVQLLFTAMQAKYLETVPMHRSQVIKNATVDGVVIEYFMIINYELIQKILSFGNQVKVLQPKWLITEHKRIAKQILAAY
ncbi:MAG TPA: WYL domain-containing protein [Chitinophagales bacterium]|nr:WYL domain-containing protein [Chitinophagales bacterium]HNM31315.1 WYL domain-containing protein [Chitinophagales bacterium]